MRTQDVLSFILDKMDQLCKTTVPTAQRRFLCEVFRTLLAMYGRITFTNMARYSQLCERTFRRHFTRYFDWVAFNLTLMLLQVHPQEQVIGVFDTTFLEKAGTKTYGLDRFFSSSYRGCRRGLEVSLIGVVGTTTRCCIGLDATQTPAGLVANEAENCYCRTDFYVEQLTDVLKRLDGRVRYWVGDGFYAKAKFFNVLEAHDRHLITRLRSDANLRFLARDGERGPTGRLRRYAGKVSFSDLEAPGNRFESVGALEDLPEVRLYTALVNSPHLKRDLRIVVLYHSGRHSYVVLATTDLGQDATEVVAFFRLRFQLELLIRDAKQHTGLGQSQARSQAKLDFHFNLSVSGVNLVRLLSSRAGVSVRSYVREQYNGYLVDRLREELGLEAELAPSRPAVRRVVETGRIAA